MVSVEKIQYRDADLIICNGITISEFDGGSWRRDLVGSRNELIQWMLDNDFHDINPDDYFPQKGNA